MHSTHIYIEYITRVFGVRLQLKHVNYTLTVRIVNFEYIFLPRIMIYDKTYRQINNKINI